SGCGSGLRGGDGAAIIPGMADEGWLERLRSDPRGRVRSWWGRRGGDDHGAQIALVVGMVLVALGVAGFLGVLDAVSENDDLATLDQPVLEGLRAARSDGLTLILT